MVCAVLLKLRKSGEESIYKKIKIFVGPNRFENSLLVAWMSLELGKSQTRVGHRHVVPLKPWD